MTTHTGKQILLQTLRAEGVRYVFGNPGTTELPLIDGLIDHPDLRYILCLHESIALTAAEAYAQMSGEVGVVNLHVAPGLGNALGHLYNAWEGHTPLVVTAGQMDTRGRMREPILQHDLVAMAAPLTKWSVQAQNADELPLLLHRAFKTAREAPTGPVFVALPMDVMAQQTANAPLTPSRVYATSAPQPEGIEAAVELLRVAQHPVILAGDGVARADAVAELVGLAELLGASVWRPALPARVAFPTDHPLYRDQLPGDHAAMHRVLGEADCVLMVGGDMLEEVWYVPQTSPFSEGTILVQIEDSPHQIGRNFPVHAGILAHPRVALRRLHEALLAHADSAFHEAAEQRRHAAAQRKSEERERQRARLDKYADSTPPAPARVMAEIAAALPENTVVVHESITAAVDLVRTVPFATERDLLGARGGGIGQGLPSAVGAKLAQPERPHLCISGDGSSLYTIQSLWSAAHHDIPVVFVILHNRTYRILKLNMNRYRSEVGISGERGYPHLDLDDPQLGYVALARGFGVEGARVERAEEIAPAVQKAFDSGKPYLLEVMVRAG